MRQGKNDSPALKVVRNLDPVRVPSRRDAQGRILPMPPQQVLLGKPPTKEEVDALVVLSMRAPENTRPSRESFRNGWKEFDIMDPSDHRYPERKNWRTAISLKIFLFP